MPTHPKPPKPKTKTTTTKKPKATPLPSPDTRRLPVTITLSQALNQKIRELLAEKGWGQRELARRLGITQGAVSYLLRDKRRTQALGYYERLAAIFGLPLSRLFSELEARVHAATHTRVRQTRSASSADRESHRITETASQPGEEIHAPGRPLFAAPGVDPRPFEETLRQHGQYYVDVLWSYYYQRRAEAATGATDSANAAKAVAAPHRSPSGDRRPRSARRRVDDRQHRRVS